MQYKEFYIWMIEDYLLDFLYSFLIYRRIDNFLVVKGTKNEI